jgi:hypothetical protein
MKKVLLSASYLLPVLALAQDSSIGGLLDLLKDLINAATPIVVALALLYFFWGLAKYILASGNEVDKDKGKDMMVWGIIALFVMVSVWGIVSLIGDTLGVEQGGTVDVPSVTI